MKKFLLALMVVLAIAPYTAVAEDGSTLHVGEGMSARSIPTDNIFIRDKNIVFIIRGEIENETAMLVEKVLYFADYFGTPSVIFEINSGGGDIHAAHEIISRMDAWRKTDASRLIETRAYGLVASAALSIFINGSEGHRCISKLSFLMAHPLRIVNSGAESVMLLTDVAGGLEKVQALNYSFLASASGKTVDEVTKMLLGREVWLTPGEAIEAGFADRLIE